MKKMICTKTSCVLHIEHEFSIGKLDSCVHSWEHEHQIHCDSEYHGCASCVEVRERVDKELVK